MHETALLSLAQSLPIVEAYFVLTCKDYRSRTDEDMQDEPDHKKSRGHFVRERRQYMS